MPDQNGLLSAAEKTTIQKRLPQTIFCPIAGAKTNYGINDYMMSPVAIGGGGEVALGGAIVPQVVLVTAAGAVIYMVAMAVGITLAAQPAPK